MIEEINKVARDTLSFMAVMGIPFTPSNYQKFFYAFWHIHEKKIKYDNPQEVFKLAEAIGRRVDIQQILKDIERRLEETEGQMVYVRGRLKNRREFEELQKVMLATANETISFIEKQKEYIKKLKEELTTKTIEAMTDGLTGLYNRGTFERDIKKLIRERKAFCLVLFDLDDFKKINDTYGHANGDRVLKTFAKILEKYPSPNLLKYRTGGEEFALVIPEGEEKAVWTANRIRQIWANKVFTMNSKPVRFTVSAGVSCYKGEKKDPEEGFWEIYEKADTALYRAKGSGKNRVEVYREGPEEGGGISSPSSSSKPHSLSSSISSSGR
ncbi:GGDEF domain-containing protein [Persephonella sp.]